MKLKPYPTYKDSGIEWLSEIPQNWKTNRLKWTVTSCKNGIWGEEPDGFHDVLCIRVADFDRLKYRSFISELTMRSISPAEANGRILQKGDLLLEKSGGGDKQLVGAVVLFNLDNKAVCSNFVSRMPVERGWDNRFLVYFHANLYDKRVNYRSVKQTTGIQNLDADSYLNEIICYPSLSEQADVASFLDKETERIDNLMVKKQRQTELLQEKRSALISHVVTKGLDPNVKMKNSRIEWLGDIPENWEVKRLRYVGRAILGLTYDPSDVVDETQGTLVLRSSNIQNSKISLHDNVYVTTEIPDKLITRIGDILICSRNGSRALIGKNAKISGNEAGVTFGAFMTTFRSKYSDYLYYVFNSQLFEFQSGLFLTSTINQLTVDNLYNLKVPLPPFEEQKEIATYLDSETNKIDKLIERVQVSIDYLNEYRTSLISAAVTGKIDVRQEVA